MATLVLQTVGTVVGSIFGPAGAAIGSALGGLAGAAIDGAFLGQDGKRKGPRLDNLQVMASSEGAPVPRLYGTARLSGQVIWATALEERVRTRTAGSKGAKQSLEEFSYFANFAVGLCEGPIGRVRRIWADGRELDLRKIVMHVHRGDEAQAPDPLIVAKEGAAEAPAYRGLAYVVFERMPLEDYGNRIPQLSFEVVKPVDGFASAVRAMTLIPGAGEFVYEARVVTEITGRGKSARVNRHLPGERADLVTALDDLEASCPNLENVSLVVAWFGDDLRAGHCRIRPKVETAARTTRPVAWRVASLTRENATLVTRGPDGRPAYGGTPTDESVVGAIAEIAARGKAVTLYPFLMMDIPQGNGLPDPATGTAGQPPYPWRGRIAVDSSSEGSAGAAAEVAAFFGSAQPGPGEWSYRRMILHYAALAEAAGGVDAFVIGSELPGLTRARSAPGIYPAVEALMTLAADVRAILRPGTRIVYGADWTEYGAHVLDGGQEVRFPLDALFASPAIDAVALDWYAPLSDWRDGTAHLDAAAGRTIHDLDYLAANIAGGEGFEWFYANDGERAAQLRRPITDGAAGKPWVFRQKDLLSWWSNAHFERVGGIELAEPTAWVQRSKPIWLLEAGCPAVDKGSNQPSAFPDAKSVEGTLPRFSDGSADPLIQARAIEALTAHWDPASPRHGAGANPLSPHYGGRMVDPARIYLWAFDARPYPAFPDASESWSDGANWALGHWLTGRLGVPGLDRLVTAVLADFDIDDVETSNLAGFVPGLVVDRPMSARDALEPLARLFAFNAIDRAGTLRLRHDGAGPVTDLTTDVMVRATEGALLSLARAQETELPRCVTVAFVDPRADFAPAVETSRRLATASRGEMRVDAALALSREEAARRADIVLQDAWIARETASFALPRSFLAVEPGDLLRLEVDGGARLHQVMRVADRGRRLVEARRIEPAVFDRALPPRRAGGFQGASPDAAIAAVLLDLPLLRDGEPVLLWAAATASPWPGPLAIWRSVEGGSFTLVASIDRPAVVGELSSALPPGPGGRFDRAGSLVVALAGTGELASRSENEVLDGANALAIRRANGSFEVLQFATAVLIAPDVYRLEGLLRGQLGTEHGDTIEAGAEVVLIDEGLVAVATSLAEIGRPATWRIGPAALDIGDPSVVELSAAAGPAALLPYAPAHPKASRIPAGIALSWIRRSRVGGDAWLAGEVPLGEERETYEVDILSEGAVRRTLRSETSSVLYSAADELTDFGAPQGRLDVAIHQMSALLGRGTPVEVTLDA